MPFNFLELKLRARRVVHSTLGVPAFYQDTPLSTPEEVRVRWHNKKVSVGDYDDQGYANVIEGIERVIFDADQARAVGVRRAGVVTIPNMGGPQGESVTLVLALQDDTAGPGEEVWQVTVKGAK